MAKKQSNRVPARRVTSTRKGGPPGSTFDLPATSDEKKLLRSAQAKTGSIRKQTYKAKRVAGNNKRMKKTKNAR